MNRLNHLGRHLTCPKADGRIVRLPQTSLPLVLTVICAACVSASAQKSPGAPLKKNGRAFFPIGCYELPKEAAGLRAMADAGFNLVRCRNVPDLDRVHAAEML